MTLWIAAFWGAAPARPNRPVIAAHKTASHGFGIKGPRTAKMGVRVYMIATTRTLASTYLLAIQVVNQEPTTRPASWKAMLETPRVRAAWGMLQP